MSKKELFSQAQNKATSGKDSELMRKKKKQQLALQKAEILDSQNSSPGKKLEGKTDPFTDETDVRPNSALSQMPPDAGN